MITDYPIDVRLETKWRGGTLRVLGRNQTLALLLEKSSRYDRLWEIADRWLNPMRWFRA